MLDVDYDLAVAWKRLVSGKYEKRDELLLRHELLELEYERKYNLTIAEAHNMANKKYNWEKQMFDELGEEGEKYGLL